jgi:hypothetical protein
MYRRKRSWQFRIPAVRLRNALAADNVVRQ